MERIFAQAQEIIDLKKEFTPAQSFNTFGQLASTLLKNAFVLAGLIAFVFLIFGGFGVIVSAGGDTKKLESGKKTITGALVGLILIVTSYWIVQIIELITGLKLLN